MENARRIAANESSLQELPHPHPISHRKKIGAFYTPLSVTAMLCDWGVRTKADLVMEPCFGGCTFVEASVEKLRALGQCSPQNNIFGFDIDPLAFRYLALRLGSAALPTHFMAGDFLNQSPDRVGLMDLVVGNPPYIRHDRFGEVQKDAAEQWKARYKVSLSGRSSLWAYFVMHGMNFLKPDGRAAWVLPGSFLSAKYARDIRAEVAKRFKRVAAITLTERLFRSEGTDELTVILLAEGYASDCAASEIEFECLDSIGELKNYLKSWGNSTKSQRDSAKRPSPGVIPRDAVSVLSDFSRLQYVKSIGDLADVKIGVVTGNSKFFVKSLREWKAVGIDRRHLTYIAPRSYWLKGARLDREDAESHINSNVPCLALKSPKNPRASALTSYLATYDPAEVKRNSTFSRRAPWFMFLDDMIPDAFLVFLTDVGPRLIVNEVSANCTNSLYRVYLKRPDSSALKLMAISLNSTFSQLSAEVIGHGRGSGALKLEPGDMRHVLLYLPPRSGASIDTAFAKMDRLLRQKMSDEVRSFVDDYLFGDSPELSSSLQRMQKGLAAGRARRMQAKPMENV